MYGWGRYVPVSERRAKARKKMETLRKQGKNIQPVEIEGRTIARSFWGKAWCDHLESFSDYENRLPRGRTYVRNGSVCHLEVQPGRVEALVSGSSLYTVAIEIKKLAPRVWATIKENCAGQVGSVLELLQGKLSDQVMGVVTNRQDGLFPQPGEITLKCSCPDWATMCKHVASVLYGVGSRLDSQPDLLFHLRGVDAQELISAEMALPSVVASGDALAEDQLGDIFGIDIDVDGPPAAPVEAARPRRATKPKQRPAARPPAKAQAKAPAKAPAPSVAVKAGAVPTGRSVFRLRSSLGLSVPEFADKLGVTAASVYRRESIPGKLKLQTRPLAALAALQQDARKK